MTHSERLIRQAIELARQARAAGNHPFGALLVVDDTVVLTAQNTVNTDRDPTAHAETNLVSEAIRRLTPDEIRRSVLYASCEPCAMCTGKIYFIDDLLPQPNWPEGHAPEVPALIENLERRRDFVTARLAWASGLMIVVRIVADN